MADEQKPDEGRTQVEAVRVKVTKSPVKAPLASDDLIAWVPPTLAEARAMPLSESLANARAEFERIKRTKEGTIGHRTYMYADHADVLDATVPTLAKYNVEIAHTIIYKRLEDERGRPTMWMFIEVSAIKGPDRRALEWPIGKIDEKNQTNGANLTYAKRYAISALLNLAPDDDTDGQAPETENRSRRDSRDRDRDDRDRRSAFDDRPNEDPDAWRDQFSNGNGRDEDRREREPDRRRDEAPRQGRTDPSQNGKQEGSIERAVNNAIDSLTSAGNKKSCEMFWDMFKKEAKLDDTDERYIRVKDVYIKRWKVHDADEKRKKDPLGANGGDERQPPKEQRREPAHAPEPDVKIEEDHISPDVALGEIENLLEKATSVAEFDRLLQDHAKLFAAASQFPPDEELLNDMKAATLDRLKESEAGDERTQRMEDVEDRDRSENRRPNLSDERF